MSGARVRMVAEGAEPGPWAEWLATVAYGHEVALVVAVPFPDGSRRVVRWPVVGQQIEIDGTTMEVAQDIPTITEDEGAR